jgi:hypothetical protein
MDNLTEPNEIKTPIDREVPEHDERPTKENLVADELITYLKARQILKDRLNATEDEIAIWVFWGGEPEMGGLDAYFTDGKGQRHQIRYCPGSDGNDDYLSVLVNLDFKAQDLQNFKPADRYIARAELIKRWSLRFGGEKAAQALIDTEKGKGLRSVDGENFWPRFGLLEVHPITGLADALDGLKLQGLFALGEVMRIEAERGLPSLQEVDKDDPAYQEAFDQAQQGLEAIVWVDWAEMCNITPEQGASLINLVDPIHNPAYQPTPEIKFLAQRLRSKQEIWTLAALVDFVGEHNAPYGMVRAVKALPAQPGSPETETPNVEPETTKPKNKINDDGKRVNQLHQLIWRVCLFLEEGGKRRTDNDVWIEICKNYPTHDTDKIIDGIIDDKIEWTSIYGNNNRPFSRASLNSTLSRIRKKQRLL